MRWLEGEGKAGERLAWTFSYSGSKKMQLRGAAGRAGESDSTVWDRSDTDWRAKISRGGQILGIDKTGVLQSGDWCCGKAGGQVGWMCSHVSVT